MKEIDILLEEAHNDEMRERNEIISKLESIRNSDNLSKKVKNKWLEQAINFMKGIK